MKHPVNLAYEAATADLNDVNMIDPFHLEAYGKTTVNYNRDVEIFPVLNAIFQRIQGASPYQSPTDMGVNMAGYCIVDDAVCCEASRHGDPAPVLHRPAWSGSRASATTTTVRKLELMMKQAGGHAGYLSRRGGLPAEGGGDRRPRRGHGPAGRPGGHRKDLSSLLGPLGGAAAECHQGPGAASTRSWT